MRGTTGVWALVIAVFLSVAVLQAMRLEHRFPSRSVYQGGLLYLPTAEQAKFGALGFVTLLADIYWVKALQYFTDPLNSHEEFRHLGDYVDLVVGVDPDFRYAYKFGGIAIPYDVGRTGIRNSERSTAVLERGVRRFPADWNLHFLLGYNYLFYQRRYKDAGEQFSIASQLPGSPKYLGPLASRTLTVGGEIDSAIAFTEHAIETATDPDLKALLEKRVVDLRVEKEFRRLEKDWKTFEARHERAPHDISELVEDGFVAPQFDFRIDARGVIHAPSGTEQMVIHYDEGRENLQNGHSK